MRKNRLIPAILLAVTLCLSGCNLTPSVEIAPTFPDAPVTNAPDLVLPDDSGSKLTPDVADDTVNDIEKEETGNKDNEDPDSQKETDKPSSAPKIADGTPFEIHGKLSVNGTQLVDKNGNAFQLCGISTHGLGWFPEYVNKDSFTTLRDDFGANVVRLAMYTAEGAGYCTGGDRTALKKCVTDGVEYASELGMYVIIDWHILHDLDPNVYKDDAKDFFTEMSKKYADYDNVIYEICNEPNGGTEWSAIKKYADEIIPIIRANDSDAIIIVGTPNWSQNVDEAVKDPIKGDNIMYAVHFYADTHKDWLRDKITVALNNGLPVFISEFSICDASGNGYNNVEEANKWIEFLDKNGISFVAWNLSNKNESSSLIDSGCSKTSGWSFAELSESGKWLVNTLNTHTDSGSAILSGMTEEEIAAASVSTTSSSASKGDMEARIQISNSWESGSDTCTQYTIVLKNKGNSNLSGWKLQIDYDRDIAIDQIWCSFGEVSGKTLTITPESYNSTISAGQSTSDIGFIIKTSGKPELPTITVK